MLLFLMEESRTLKSIYSRVVCFCEVVEVEWVGWRFEGSNARAVAFIDQHLTYFRIRTASYEC
jgi:hypothetical protein